MSFYQNEYFQIQLEDPSSIRVNYNHLQENFDRRDSTNTLIGEDSDNSSTLSIPLKPKVLELTDANNIFVTKTIKPAAPSATVCVIGVGYVGETLVRDFGRHYSTIGFDISANRIAAVKSKFTGQQNVELTNLPSDLARATHFLVSVPTLLNADNTIDTKPLCSALATITKFARPGSTIVIESSVCIGMTRKLLAPYQNEYHCGMSPERVDPGRISPAPTSIPKIVSGLTPTALNHIQELYGAVFDNIVPVSTPEVAEATKLYENCFRMVNIAYVNEISDALESHNINVKEVMKAAGTKPFGFMPFSPGLGVGGNCIPINPYYLKVNCHLPVLETSSTLMAKRPAKLAKQFFALVCGNLEGQSALKVCQPRILVVGLGFKPGQSSIVESPGVAFAKELEHLDCASLDYYDPLVAPTAVPFIKEMDSCNWNEAGIQQNYDGVAVCVRQTGIDFDVLETVSNTMIKWY
jgi:nucleotide sugar dehydrogenase